MQLSVPRFCLNFRDLPSASSHPQMSTTFYAGQNWNQEPRIQNQVFFVDGRGLSSWAATYCFPECTNRKLGSKVDPEPNANTLTPDVRVASDKLQVVSQFLHQMPALMSIALFLLISFFPLLEISMWPPLVHGVHGRSRPLLLQFYFGLYIQPFSHTCANSSIPHGPLFIYSCLPFLVSSNASPLYCHHGILHFYGIFCFSFLLVFCSSIN